MQLAQILGAVREGWQSFNVEVLGASVLMSGIIVGLVIGCLKSDRTHRISEYTCGPRRPAEDEFGGCYSRCEYEGRLEPASTSKLMKRAAPASDL